MAFRPFLDSNHASENDRLESHAYAHRQVYGIWAAFGKEMHRRNIMAYNRASFLAGA